MTLLYKAPHQTSTHVSGQTDVSVVLSTLYKTLLISLLLYTT